MREERDVANREWTTESQRSLALGHRVAELEAALLDVRERMVGGELQGWLLRGEARPPPEHYDEVTVACFTLPAEVAAAARLPDIAARHRVHKMRGDGGRFVCVAGTNHVAHDLAFDQARTGSRTRFRVASLSWARRSA